MDITGLSRAGPRASAGVPARSVTDAPAAAGSGGRRAGEPTVRSRVRAWLTPALVVGVALVGFVASALTALALERQQQRHTAQSLDRQTELVRQTVIGETHRYEETLSALAASVGAQSNLTAHDFAEITSTLSRDSLPGLAGVSLAVPVAPDRVPAAQRFWRARGSSDLVLRPVRNDRGEHRFLVLSRTLAGGEGVLGRDTTASLESFWALELAAVTGLPAASETYVLLRDRSLPAGKRQLSFVIATPVRVNGHDGVDRAWLIMALRGRDFLSRTLRQVSQGLVDVVLIDATAGAGVGTPVAAWPAQTLVRSENRWRRTIDVPIAQRTWQVEVYATAELAGGDVSQLPAAAGVAGLAITVLLAGLVLALASSRERALTAVCHATVALEADIARREEIERRLRRSEAELRGFAGVAAHDLKAPLAAASARLELLAEEGSLDDRAHRDVAKARESIGRMNRLIADLLAYATADQADLRWGRVDLASLAAEIVLDRMTMDSGDPAREPLIGIGPLPAVQGDPGMLRQLLENLIGNALKYVPPGRRPEVAVRSCRMGDAWRIEVADRGIGVPAEQRGSIFDAFRRARGSEHYPGTGLGLAICHRIVHRHGGEIGVTENPDGGSVFWFTLPAVQPCPAGERSIPEVEPLSLGPERSTAGAERLSA